MALVLKRHSSKLQMIRTLKLVTKRKRKRKKKRGKFFRMVKAVRISFQVKLFKNFLLK
jgi:hypothetical protein